MTWAKAHSLSPEEARAVRCLQRLAKRWPVTLLLVHQADTGLLVKREKMPGPGEQYDANKLESIAKIDIPVESCS